jgi:hypothetical protein
VVLQVPEADLAAGAHLPIDAVTGFGLVYRYTPASGLQPVGSIVDGWVDVVDAATAAGATVSASFHGLVVRSRSDP